MYMHTVVKDVHKNTINNSTALVQMVIEEQDYLNWSIHFDELHHLCFIKLLTIGQ